MLQILNYPKFQQVTAKFAAKFDTKTAEGRGRLLVLSAFSLGVFLLYDNLFGKQHVYKQSCIFYARHFKEKQPFSSLNEEELIKLVDEGSCFEEAVEHLNTDLSEEDFKELKEILADLMYATPQKLACADREGQVAFRRRMAAIPFDIYANYFPDAPLWMRLSLPFLDEHINSNLKKFSKIGLFVLSLRYLVGELQCTLSKAKGHTEPKTLSFLKKLEISKEYKNLRIVAALVAIIGIIINQLELKLPTGLDSYLDQFPPTAPFSMSDLENDSHTINPCMGKALINLCKTEEKRVIFVEGGEESQNEVFKSANWLSRIYHVLGLDEEPLFFSFDLKKYPPSHTYNPAHDPWKKITQKLWAKMRVAKKPILIIKSRDLDKNPNFQKELEKFIETCFLDIEQLKVVVETADKDKDYNPHDSKYNCFKKAVGFSLEESAIKYWKCDSESLLDEIRKSSLKVLDNLLFISEKDWKKTPAELFQDSENKVEDFIKALKDSLPNIQDQELKKLLSSFDQLKNEIRKLNKDAQNYAHKLLNTHKWWYGDKAFSLHTVNTSLLRKKAIRILLLKKGLEKKKLKEAFKIQADIDRVCKRLFPDKSLMYSYQ